MVGARHTARLVSAAVAAARHQRHANLAAIQRRSAHIRRSTGITGEAGRASRSIAAGRGALELEAAVQVHVPLERVRQRQLLDGALHDDGEAHAPRVPPAAPRAPPPPRAAPARTSACALACARNTRDRTESDSRFRRLHRKYFLGNTHGW